MCSFKIASYESFYQCYFGYILFVHRKYFVVDNTFFVHVFMCMYNFSFLFILDFFDASEGDSHYIADELLKGRFSTAADIFSLGISLLELACDLELPSGGEGWHSLRNGELTKYFVKGTHLCIDVCGGEGISSNYCQ